MEGLDERHAAERPLAPRAVEEPAEPETRRHGAASVHGIRPHRALASLSRYHVRGNRRIRQVRTVVWEDGSVRPVLPDCARLDILWHSAPSPQSGAVNPACPTIRRVAQRNDDLVVQVSRPVPRGLRDQR